MVWYIEALLWCSADKFGVNRWYEIDFVLYRGRQLLCFILLVTSHAVWALDMMFASEDGKDEFTHV